MNPIQFLIAFLTDLTNTLSANNEASDARVLNMIRETRSLHTSIKLREFCEALLKLSWQFRRAVEQIETHPELNLTTAASPRMLGLGLFTLCVGHLDDSVFSSLRALIEDLAQLAGKYEQTATRIGLTEPASALANLQSYLHDYLATDLQFKDRVQLEDLAEEIADSFQCLMYIVRTEAVAEVK